MKKSSVSPSTIVTVTLLSWPFLAQADEDRKTVKEKAAESKLPAESEQWTVELKGFAGTPSDRICFRWKLSHDGSLEAHYTEVKYDPLNRGGPEEVDVPLEKAKLTPEEVRKIYKSVTKIMTEFDPKKSFGVCDDGYNFTLKVKGESSETSAKYTGISRFGRVSPELTEIHKIIKKKLTQKGWYYDNGHW